MKKTSLVMMVIVVMMAMFCGCEEERQTTTGFLSDYLRPEYGNLSIRYALITMVMVNLWCATHNYLATRTLREDLARAPA